MTVELVNAETGEVVDSLTEPEARRLTERIRVALDRVSTAWADLAERITEAYQRRADLALGYRSWAEYAEAELKPSEGLAADVRRQLVGMLSAQGMSTRAIAPTVGVSQQAVAKSLRHPDLTTRLSPVPDPVGVDGGEAVAPTAPSPVTVAAPAPAPPAVEVAGPTASATTPPAKRATVTGLDGKTYTRPEPKPERRRSIIDAARDAASELHRAAERVERIYADDRYPRNREQVADVTRGYLSRTVEIIGRLNS